MIEGWATMPLVGRVARAHGNRGQVIVNPETDFPEDRFRPGARLFLRRGDAVEAMTVTSVRFHRGRPILALDGVTTMDDAERLAGAELRVPEEELTPLPPETFYRHDLVGCDVVTTDGRSVGPVERVEGELERSWLIVRRANRELMIPLVATICAEIDLAARRIVVTPPEGLLDLTA